MQGFLLSTLGLIGSMFLSGCSSEESTDFQEFSQLDPVVVPEPEPPEEPVEIPLVAPKPVIIQNLGVQDSTELSTGMLRPIRLQVPEKTFRTDPKTGEIVLSFLDLDLFDVLNMEPVPPDAIDHFPEWMKQLDGKQVTVRGFMVATARDRVESFLLARDNAACCMGPETRVYHLMNVMMKEGSTIEYLPLFAYQISGTFRIHPICDEGHWSSLFVIEDAVRRK